MIIIAILFYLFCCSLSILCCKVLSLPVKQKAASRSGFMLSKKPLQSLAAFFFEKLFVLYHVEKF